jgi:DNA-binding MarR family transcriptional regulator
MLTFRVLTTLASHAAKKERLMSARQSEPGFPPPVGLSPLDASVLEGFRRAAHLNRQMFTRMVGFEKHGRPGRAIMLLVLSGANDGVTQRELADTLHISPPTVTVMLQKMEQHGLIERWTDETDQRLTRIRMTEKGREIVEPIQANFSTYTKATLGAMSKTDRREFARLLGVFADSMEAALKQPNE